MKKTKKELKKLIKEAKSKNPGSQEAKKLAKQIRLLVTQIYNLQQGTRSLKQNDLQQAMEYLAVAKKIEGRTRRTQWSHEIKIVEKGNFKSPLISPDFPFIQITGFVAGMHELFKDGEKVRVITGMMIVFDLDNSDQRAKDILPATIYETPKYDMDKKRIISIGNAEKKLEERICSAAKELIGEKKYILTFWKDTTWQYMKHFEFKVKAVALNKGRVSPRPLLRDEIEKNKNEIGRAINSTYYSPVYQIGPVRDGGQRFKG